MSHKNQTAAYDKAWDTTKGAKNGISGVERECLAKEGGSLQLNDSQKNFEAGRRQTFFAVAGQPQHQ